MLSIQKSPTNKTRLGYVAFPSDISSTSRTVFVNEKWKLTSNIKQVCARSVNKITMRKISNTRIFVNEVENSI
jgi:hypothetical protein